MLNELKLMSIVQLINFRTLTFIHKIVNGQAPAYLTKRIKLNSETQIRTLRNANEINVPNLTKTCSQNSLFYKGVKLYNSLPAVIKSQESESKFTNLLKEYIRQIF